jgi:cell wall-associated NlpC family hydrolase
VAHKAPPRPKRQLARAARPTIMQQAQTEIDPIIAAITGAANKKAAAAEAAIKGYTDSYAHQLGGQDAGAPYSGAETEQAAVDASLRQALAGGGSDLASQLSARLAALQGSSGAGALAQEGGALASQGESAGNTRLASGSAALSALLGEHAAASSFSKKLPGLAKLSGLQGLRQSEGNAQQEISQGTMQAEGELPSIVQQIRSSRQAAAALRSENAYRGAELQQGQQRLGIESFRAQTSAAQGNARIQIEGERAAQAASHDRALERMARLNYGLSAQRLILAQSKAMQIQHSGGLTAGEYGTLRQKASKDLQSYYDGVAAKYQIGPDGNRVLVSGTGPGSAKTYQQAIKHLILSYPQLGPKQIIGMADKLYRPGEGGRPLKGTGVGASFFDNAFQAESRGFGAAGGAAETAAAHKILGLARKYIGTPYVWGGESPKGFDCSGFAQYLYGKAGIRIPRTTYTQWQTGHSVPQGQLQPGDLVFFRGSDSKGGLPGHVGVYIGNGMMIDAPHTGASVRTESIATFGGYMGARRYGKG